jgi:hypothetical protein
MLNAFSTLDQLYHGSQFNVEENQITQCKPPTYHKELAKLHHIGLYRVHLTMIGIGINIVNQILHVIIT